MVDLLEKRNHTCFRILITKRSYYIHFGLKLNQVETNINRIDNITIYQLDINIIRLTNITQNSFRVKAVVADGWVVRGLQYI